MFVRREEYPQEPGDTIKEYIDIVALGRSSILLSDLLSACQPEESQAHIRVFASTREAPKNGPKLPRTEAAGLKPSLRSSSETTFC